MTRLGTERKSAGRTPFDFAQDKPAVLKTAEESSQLMPGLFDQGQKKRRQDAGGTNGAAYLIAEREAFDIPIQGIQSVVGGYHGAVRRQKR